MNSEEKTVYENENKVNIDENTVYEEVENQAVESENQEEVAEEKNGNSRKGWGRVAAGFGGGIVMGSLATILTASSRVPGDESADELKPEVEVPGLIGEIEVAQSVNDDMSFNEAFAAARAEVGSGGAFVWHGNVYNTYTAEEWNAMTDEQRDAFGDNFQSQVDNIIDTPTNDQVTHTEVYGGGEGVDIIDTVPGNNTVEVADITPEVEVVGMAQDPDSGAMVAGVKVDEQEFMFVDTDNNNEVDVVVADLNGDGIISENEIGYISGQGVYMSDLAAMQNSQDLVMGPDYTNDADTAGYEA